MTIPRSRLPFFAAALAVAASLAVCASAHAAAPDDREAQRTELYREAMKEAAAGRWGEAKEKLRAALAIRPSPKVLFSLGQAEEQLGQLASAQGDYARSLESAATEGKSDVVEAAAQAQHALAPRVPHLRVIIGESDLRKPDLGPAGAAATLDDQPITIGAPVAVNPGEHHLTVRALGMRTTTVDLRIAEGQQVERTVSLVAEEATFATPTSTSRATTPAPAIDTATTSPTVESSPSANAGATARTAGLIVAGVGVIAFGVGAVFGVESMEKHNDAQSACPSAACPTTSGAALWHDAVTAGNESTVAFIVGGVGVLAGAILWLAAPRSPVPARVGLGPGRVQIETAW